MGNPYLQYFIGIDCFWTIPPIKASSLTIIRKGNGNDALVEINEMIINPKFEY